MEIGTVFEVRIGSTVKSMLNFLSVEDGVKIGSILNFSAVLSVG